MIRLRNQMGNPMFAEINWKSILFILVAAGSIGYFLDTQSAALMGLHIGWFIALSLAIIILILFFSYDLVSEYILVYRLDVQSRDNLAQAIHRNTLAIREQMYAEQRKRLESVVIPQAEWEQIRKMRWDILKGLLLKEIASTFERCQFQIGMDDMFTMTYPREQNPHSKLTVRCSNHGNQSLITVAIDLYYLTGLQAILTGYTLVVKLPDGSTRTTQFQHTNIAQVVVPIPENKNGNHNPIVWCTVHLLSPDGQKIAPQSM